MADRWNRKIVVDLSPGPFEDAAALAGSARCELIRPEFEACALDLLRTPPGSITS